MFEEINLNHIAAFETQNTAIPEEELVEYIKEFQKTKCPILHEKIIIGRLEYIKYLCNYQKKRNTYLEYTEILSSVFEGINKAIEGFKADKGTKFTTYAITWVRFYVSNNIIRNTSRVGISQAIYSKISRLSGYIEKDENITDKELGEKLGISERKVKEFKNIQNCMSNYSTSDPTISNQMELELYNNNNISCDYDFVRECVNELEPRKAAIVSQRFGLNGEKEKTLMEIADNFGVTFQRIQQIIKHALPELKSIYVKKMEEESKGV